MQQAIKPELTQGQAWASRLSTVMAVGALIVVACMAFVGVEVSRVLDHRAEVLADGKRDTANLTSSLLQHAELTFRIADALLLATRSRVEQRALTSDDWSSIKSWIDDETHQSGQFSALTVIGSDGRSVISSIGRAGLNLADREFFIYHRDHDDRELRIGVPVQARSSSSWLIPVTRRVNRPDGSFGGVVLAGINPQIFQDLYDRLDVGANGTILLASMNAKLLVRRPFVATNVGRDLADSSTFRALQNSPAGSLEIVAATDGVRRFNSYEQGKTYPIVVAVAQDLEELLAPWRAATMRRGGRSGRDRGPDADPRRHHLAHDTGVGDAGRRAPPGQ